MTLGGRAAGGDLAEALALEQLRDDVREGGRRAPGTRALVCPLRADVLDRQDVRVIEGGDDFGFLLEALEAGGVGGICRPLGIVFNPQNMLSSVNFNNKPTLNANEINNEGTYGVLSSELVSSQPPIPQMIPQKPLGIGLVLTQDRGFSFHSPLTLTLSP